MKKLMLALLLMFASAALVNAQDTTNVQDENQYNTEQDQLKDDDLGEKDMISVAELPDNAKSQLQGQDYISWTIKNTYRKLKDEETIYVVELASGDQVKKVKFDAQGNMIKEKVKQDNN